MGVTIIRPSTHLLYPGSRGVRVSQPGGAAATPWYLSGGIPAANAIAVYQPKGASSLLASYDNLAAPGNGLPDGTYDAAPGVAPTFDAATGWTFNGITQYLTTGITPGTAYSLIIRFSNGPLGGAAQCCVCAARTANFIIASTNGSGNRSFANGTSITIAGGELASGVMAIAGTKAYTNGIVETGTFTPATCNFPLWIGALNNATVYAQGFPGKVKAVAIYNVTLDAPTILAVSTAMAAL